MVTLSLKREMTNVKGKMIPCHSPSQKPATEPSAPGEPLKKFGPAAQPAEKQRTSNRRMPKTASNLFFTGLLAGVPLTKGGSKSVSMHLNPLTSGRPLTFAGKLHTGSQETSCVAPVSRQNLIRVENGARFALCLGLKREPELGQELL